MSASGLDSVKTTAILFWVFLFGSPVLWFLSAIFEDVILPKSTQDIFSVGRFVGSAQTFKSYFYVMAAQLLYPTVLSVVEAFGIAIFFIVQISFLENIYGPENLPLQMASIIVCIPYFCWTSSSGTFRWYNQRKWRKWIIGDIKRWIWWISQQRVIDISYSC